MPANTAKRLSRIRGLSFTQSFSLPEETKPASPFRGEEVSRPRSVSPRRTKSYDWEEFCRIDEVDEDDLDANGGVKKARRWSLKDFLYRSISEGRGRAREKEMERERLVQAAVRAGRKNKPPTYTKLVDHGSKKLGGRSAAISKKLITAKETAIPPRPQTASKVLQKKDTVSAHERYYSANRARAQAQAAEMKKKTFLPYRQGLFGCLGPFPSSNSSNHRNLLPAS